MASQSTLSAFAVAAERVNGATDSPPAIAMSQAAFFAVWMIEWRFFITLGPSPTLQLLGLSGWECQALQGRYMYVIGTG